jgi:hypothetical protein
MPGQHLDIKIMQCFRDVGWCDAWLGSYWGPNQQWFIGWHSPRALRDWSWPSQEWTLIGYELWQYPRRGEPKLREALYATPNPSMTPPHLLTPPNGHWHVRYSLRGRCCQRMWVATPPTEDEHLYLKGGGTGPKGKGKGQGKDQGKGNKGKGEGKNMQGQGRGQERRQGQLSLSSGRP